ncbi:MAG: hypothetical protein ACJ762_14990 [Solirubrobacteraceae bacterium]
MRELAVDLFNRVWGYMDDPERTARETQLMIHAAHASRHHWEEAGGPVNHARGEWQISRAYTVARRAEPALHHAVLCLETAEQHDLGPFDLACAHEALARAHALAGDGERSAHHVTLARDVAARIEDPEERQVVLDDLATI